MFLKANTNINYLGKLMLKAENISLRAVEPADAELMYEWENQVKHWYVSGTTSPIPKFVLREFTKIENQDVTVTKQVRLVINHDNTGKAIGCIDLFDVDLLNKRAGVGILIGDDAHRGKGYAHQALMLLKKYSLQILHLHQLFCNIHESNAGSLNLFAKAGFHPSGTLKEWTLHNGRFENVIVMQCFLHECLSL